MSPSSTSRSSSFSSSSSQARVDRRAGRARDLRVRRRVDGLALVPELLVQLLAGPGADELDLRRRLLAGEADHVLGEVDDLHRLAHVEHVDLAAAADRAGLDDERRRLRDRHEVARHLGVRDGQRPAALDLAPEDRHDRARTSRARCRSARRRSASARRRGARTSRRPTRRAPSTGPSRSSGSTALSVEMSTNRSAPNSTATSATAACREHVVPHGLERVRLHQRHVLVRRGVEDDLGPVALEDLPQLRAVAAVGEHRHARGELALVDELALDLEERRSRRSRRARAAPAGRARSGGRAPSRSTRRRR